jgi:hypothetical protein
MRKHIGMACLILFCCLLASREQVAFAAKNIQHIAGVQPSGADGSIDLRRDTHSPFFRHQSTLLVGDKGEQVLDVSAFDASCGTTVWAFDHAELLVHDARFAHAQLVQIPDAGCVTCRPLVVRWFHEPTGRLDFSIEVFRRPILLQCGDRDPHE